MKTITNMAGVQNFEVVSIKFNADGILRHKPFKIIQEQQK